jgi:hypothetical protein
MGKSNDPVWGELNEVFPQVTAKAMTYGVVLDSALVLFQGAYPGGKLPSWGNKITLEVIFGIDKTFYPLNSSCKTAFFIQERIFDKFLEEAGLDADLAELREKILHRSKEVCDLRAMELNSADGLSPQEAKAKAAVEKKLKEYNEKLEETHAKVFTFYEQFMGPTRTQGFTRILDKLLDTETTFERHEYELVAEAYEKDSDGVSTGVRRPELDNTDDDDPDATHILVWKVEERRYQEVAKYVKDKTAFEKARRLHRLQVMGKKYGVAEAQRAYLSRNLKLPANYAVSASVLLGVIQNISAHLYLLPSLKDHPDVADNPEVVAANVPLTRMEMCDVLRRAMPKRAIAVYESKRINDCPVEFDADAMASEFDKILDQLSADDKQKGSGGADNKSHANPKSAPKRNGGGNGGGNPKGASSGKVCKRCKKHHPDKEKLWKSHFTNDCKKYDADDKPLPTEGQGRNTPRKRVYALEKDDGEYTPRHRSSKKKKKSKKRKSKKSSKRSRRSRSSSVSSSSSSASGSSSSSSE